MACGSVFASEPGLAGRDLPPPPDLSPDLTTQLTRSSPYRADGEVHEAIRFLQAEHEAVLRGLHHQMTLLQQRCDDLQFEAHLRHLTVDEAAWRRRLAEASRKLEERTARVAQLEGQLAAAEEERQQHRWREVQLEQQVEAGERRVADLRGEVTRLRAQVRDLRVYSSALRTVGGGRGTSSRPSSRSQRPTSRASVGSQESLEGGSGPRSLGSEDGEAGGWWREARLGGTGSRGPRGPVGSQPRTSTVSLPPSLPSPPPSLPPLASLPAPGGRPSSGAVTLPPITPGRGGGARQVRHQMRLTSAPAPGPRGEIVPQREPA